MKGNTVAFLPLPPVMRESESYFMCYPLSLRERVGVRGEPIDDV